MKDVTVRIVSPRELRDYLGALALNHEELRVLAQLFSFEPHYAHCFFGHFAELHERIAGGDSSFSGMTDSFKRALSKDKDAPCKIGISRYNFFCLDQIAASLLELKGMRGIQLSPLTVSPPERLIHNFIVYAGQIQAKLKDAHIDLVLFDSQLIELLQLVQFHAQRGKVSEKGLLRLFGIVAEHAFIGPQTIVFDPYHKCNLRCAHCFVHNPRIRHPQEFLDRQFDYGAFQRIIDDAARLRTDNIILQGDGEPLLYDAFFDMVRYARAKDIDVMFFTNGSLLDEQKAREAVRVGVQGIYCSLPAGTAQTYARVTATGTKEMFDSTVENLRRLLEIRKEQGASRPRLIMTHVIHALNYHELIAMARIGASLGADASRFYLIRLDENNVSLKLNDAHLKSIRKDLPLCARILKQHRVEFIDNIFFQLAHYDRDTGAWSKDVFLDRGCMIGWYFCLIPAKYDASLCCHLRTTGHLDRQSFKDLWESREYRRYRIKAKYLKRNTEFVFPNGVRLYDQHCQHCDNHQGLLAISKELRSLEFDRFLNTDATRQ
jgi:MoaA/NifB/PqqE/SkfB family radical SAM enzyme